MDQTKTLILAEGNFEEHPYFRVGDRNAGTGVLQYENELRTKEGHILKQSWVVRGAHGRGLPGRFDQDVYVALLQRIDFKGLPDDGWLSFSLYEVVELMGRSHSGRDYMQVRDSLQRMATTTVESNNAFYHRGRKEYISDTFSLLSEVKLSEYEERDGSRSDRNRVLLSRYFVDSYKANYLKDIDPELYWSLSSPVAKRLYRLIDKKRNGRKTWEAEIFSLRARIPLSDYKYASKVKEKLAPAHAELVQREFLDSVSYRKDGKQEFVGYKITDAFQARRSTTVSHQPTGEELFCIQRLKAEGMSAETAEDLVATYGTIRTMHYVEALPYQKNVRNPAGWLRRAIVEGYDLGLPTAATSPGFAEKVVSDKTDQNVGVEVADSDDQTPPKLSEKQRDPQESEESAENGATGLTARGGLQERAHQPATAEPKGRGSAPNEPGSNSSDPDEAASQAEAQEAWEALVESLVALRGREALPPWFDGFSGGELDGSTLTILVPNSTAANHLNDNFGEDLLRLWRQRSSPHATLQVAVDLYSGRRAALAMNCV